MTKLIPVFIIAMILAFLSEKLSYRVIDENGEKYYIKKETFIFLCMAIVLIVFCGLRITYNDTETYIYNYLYGTSEILDIKSINWRIGANPGYNFIKALFRSARIGVNTYLMFYALLTNGIYLWFIRKYSSNVLTTLFLFFTIGCYLFTFAAIKQCAAVAFCLLAVNSYLKNRKQWFIFWIIIAVLFHPYSLMFLVVPLLDFEPWSNKTYILIGLALAIAVTLQSLMSTIVGITSMMGEEYDLSSFSGPGVNWLRVVVMWAPIILSFCVRDREIYNTSKENKIFFNLSLINAAIMFIGLFGTANYFARLANYFLIFQCISIPQIVDKVSINNRKIVSLVMFFSYLYFFYYSNIIYGGFDFMYTSITLGDFVRQFFGG